MFHVLILVPLCNLSTFSVYVMSCDCHIVSLSDVPLLLLPVSILFSSYAVIIVLFLCNVFHINLATWYVKLFVAVNCVRCGV